MNCPTALNSLALMIEPTNQQDAINLYREAHKLGNLDATVNLAFAYQSVSLTQLLCFNKIFLAISD